jgi:opacity protein-like surface antigen
MKKIVLSITAMLAVSGAMAQGPYAAFSVGYAGPAAQEQLGTDFNQTSATAYTETNIMGTYGGGIPVSLQLGYMFTEHVGFDLGFNYFMGNEVTISTQKSFLGDDIKTTTKGYQIRVLPQLVISSGSDNTLGLYSKFGLVLPVAGKTTFQTAGDQFTFPSTTSILVEGESTGQFSLGYTGSLGANFNLSDNLSLFGELQFINLRIKGDTQTITKYEFGGQDIISNFDKEDLETVYVDELNQDSNSDSNKPKEELRNSSNYNSFGLNVGIRFKF